MNFQEKLLILKQNQDNVLEEYKTLLAEYESDGLISQNEELQKELIECKGRLDQLEVKYKSIKVENERLRISLQEQILDEKLDILKISREKLDTYFKNTVGDCENRLMAFERQSEKEISQLRSTAMDNLGHEKEMFAAEISQWSQALGEKIREHRKELNDAAVGLTTGFKTQFDALATEGVSEEIIQKRIKQNETEMKIGLNCINKIGIILILFGVGAAAKYVHSTWFNDYMRGASFFVLGGLFLVGGEWFYRKGKDVLGNGLLGGGVSILYGAVFYSYFLLHIIDIHIGLFMSVLITLTTVVLAVRYQSKTICSLGLIGGYLPFFSYLMSFGIRGEACYIAMGYLLLLNLSVLGVSFWKKWDALNYLSMLFHIPSLIYLVFIADNAFVAMLYTVLTFSTHLITQLAYPLKYAVAIKRVDLMLMGANTFLSCVILYGLFGKAGLVDYQGVLALAFCLIYITVGKLIDRKIPNEKNGCLLFYATAMTFAVLMIPFQFGIQWMSMGWLVESVILIVYSLAYQIEKMEKAGWVIFGLCLGAFYLGDWLRMLPLGNVEYFTYRFTAITLGTILVTAAYLRDSQKEGMAKYGKFWDTAMSFKYFTIINVWIYLLYIGGEIYNAWMPHGYHFDFYKTLLMAIINMTLGYFICRIPLLYNKVIQGFSIVFYLFGILLCTLINLFIPVMKNIEKVSAAEYGAITVLIIFNLLLLVVVRELLISIIKRQHINLEIYPLGIIIYLLGNVTIILTKQFHLGGGHFLSSLVCLLAALGSLVYGFRKNYIYTRRFGLGLSVFATIKLFLIDLIFLDSLKKIIAYFVFGFVLLGISYLYQQLRANAEGRDDDRKM
ncbi:DUF2339 domain-containing protein [Pelosinus fermentans]|uniref:DUF2339 domain-containing protein n=1 Tax=Pelosinus fermentans JBW45 TaxID=1192197 RepID=I9DKP5_9FIRM|nr:DUF2339 domain-containing protein [Pelosinus fermentans]AJQ29103.1 Protein of unknown function DUF2339, transmembrane [Pelosinus fermentans JBW45]